MHFRRRRLQRTTLPGGDLRFVLAGGNRHQATVGLPQHTGEQLPEARECRDALLNIPRMPDLHRRHLPREVGRQDVQDALARDRRRVVRTRVDRDVERGGGRPHLEQRPVNYGLEAVEEVGLALGGVELHAIAHVARVHLILVKVEQVEGAIDDGERCRRQFRGVHRPVDARRMLGVRDHLLHVVGHDGQDEVHRRAVALAAIGAGGEVGELGGGEVAAHLLGELQSGLDRLGDGARRRGQGVVDRPAAILGHQGEIALRQRRDREQRVHAERTRHDRTVADVQAVVHLGAGGSLEDAALVVYHPGFRGVGHDAAAERVHGDDVVVQESAPRRVLDVDAAQGV